MMNRRSFLKITAGLAGVAAAGAFGGVLATSPSLHTMEATHILMGTRVHLQVVAPRAAQAQEAIDAALHAMRSLIALFDHRQATSPLARLNQTGSLHGAPAAFIALLQRAVWFGDRSRGAFDVTVKPLLDGWRSQDATAMAQRHLVDYRQIRIADDSVFLDIPGAQVTLDGIAKGQVIDGGVNALRALGFDHVLVEAGGDLRTLGTRADDQPWQVGIAHPRHKALVATLPVREQAMATSGDYMDYFSQNMDAHHIIDPRSGASPRELASVTVAAPTAADADALATAMMVMGSRDALALANELPGVDALLVTKTMEVVVSDGFAALGIGALDRT